MTKLDAVIDKIIEKTDNDELVWQHYVVSNYHKGDEYYWATTDGEYKLEKNPPYLTINSQKFPISKDRWEDLRLAASRFRDRFSAKLKQEKQNEIDAKIDKIFTDWQLELKAEPEVKKVVIKEKPFYKNIAIATIACLLFSWLPWWIALIIQLIIMILSINQLRKEIAYWLTHEGFNNNEC